MDELTKRNSIVRYFQRFPDNVEFSAPRFLANSGRKAHTIARTWRWSAPARAQNVQGADGSLERTRIRDAQPMTAAVMEAAYRSSAGDVQRMHELGVEILAGIDAGSVLVYPGFALHEELRLLVQDAKLSARAARWSATIGPARFARLEDRLGTIAPGKIADIVLLDADPLADIRNTRRIFAVIQGSRVFARSDLDALLSGVRSAVIPPTP